MEELPLLGDPSRVKSRQATQKNSYKKWGVLITLMSAALLAFTTNWVDFKESTHQEADGQINELSSESNTAELESELEAEISSPETPPHIVMFLIDDQGYGDAGARSDLSWATPTITRLSQEGITLSRYYSLHLCTPARAALLTGLYPIHNGMQHSLITGFNPWGLSTDFELLPEVLQRNGGYSTHLVGKWHVGHFQEAQLPLQRGFDSFFGFYGGYDDYWTHISEPSSCGHQCFHDLRHEQEVLASPGSELPRLLCKHASEILEDHNQTKPLFMLYSMPMVHSPLYTPPEFLNEDATPVSGPFEELLSSVANDQRRTIAAMTLIIDQTVDNITQTLQREGMYENSVIIIASDNGSPAHEGGTNWPLRGMKGYYFEGALRVHATLHSPLLPTHTRGQRYGHYFHVTDWLPTLVNGVAGGSLEGLELDGYDHWAALQGRARPPRTEILHNIDVYVESPGMNTSLGDNILQGAYTRGDWKVVFGQQYQPRWAPRDTNGGINRKLAHMWTKNAPRTFLFNITADPFEDNDMTAQFPDVLDDMMSRVAEFRTTVVAAQYCGENVTKAAVQACNIDGFMRPWIVQADFVCTDATLEGAVRDYCLYRLLPAEFCVLNGLPDGY